MRNLTFIVVISIAVCTSTARSQTFKTLVEFTGTGGTASGAYPQGSLTLVGSRLYGMTQAGGANGDGNVFSVGTNGTIYQNLVSFTGAGGSANGGSPSGNLTLVGSGLYGMTYAGGNYLGNIFCVGTNGTNYQNLVSFPGYAAGTASGQYPSGSLTLVGGALYGMTNSGGADHLGNVFSVGTNGTGYQSLLSFTGWGSTVNAQYPLGNLTLVGSELYGMTQEGGANNDFGNVFSVGSNGTGYQNIVSFTGTGGVASGEYPQGSLTLVGTRLYGMTRHGGTRGYGNVFSVGTDGTGYQNLVSFTDTGGTASGYGPYGSLILSGTALYGMTSQGGFGNGNIFSVGLNGSGYQDLYNFTGGADGGFPFGDLLLSGGTLFGTTAFEGAGNGTVFAYTSPALITPEPGTLGLAGAGGAAALVSYRWRRRRRRKSVQFSVVSVQYLAENWTLKTERSTLRFLS